MAIPTGILDYPDIGRLPTNVTFTLKSNTTVFQSPIGGATQTLEVPGAYWKGTVIYNNLLPEQARKLNAFLVKLRGRSGRFWFGNLSYDSPSYSNLNSQPAFNANLLTISDGNIIDLQNTSWPLFFTTTKVARAGDYVALRYKYTSTDYTQSLHMLTSDLGIIGSVGNKRVRGAIEPPIRRPWSSSVNPTGTATAYIGLDTTANIDYTNAVSIFRLDTDTVDWSIRPRGLQSVQFTVCEAFDNGNQ